jgi:hypothetical protein
VSRSPVIPSTLVYIYATVEIDGSGVMTITGGSACSHSRRYTTLLISMLRSVAWAAFGSQEVQVAQMAIFPSPSNKLSLQVLALTIPSTLGQRSTATLEAIFSIATGRLLSRLEFQR